MKYTYPSAPRDDSIVEDFHGTAVADPFRPLEDPDAEHTQKWVQEEQAVFNNFIQQKSSLRETLLNRLTETANYQKVYCPFKRGNKIFFSKNDGLQDQNVLYQVPFSTDLSSTTLLEKATVLIDENKLSSDGTAAVRSYSFTEDGKFLAYSVSYSGSDWCTILIKNTDTLQELEDKIHFVKFSNIAWKHDNSGFFYGRYPAPKTISTTEVQEGNKLGRETDKNLHHKVYFHKVGTTQDEDVLIYEDTENAEWIFSPDISDDGNYLFIYVSKGAEKYNQFYYAELTKETLQVVKLINNFEAEYSNITNEGTVFYFKTNANAPHSKVISMDILQPNQIKEIIPEKEDPLEYVICSNQNYFVACYCHNVQDVLYIFDLQGKLIKQMQFDNIGSIERLSGRKEDNFMFYQFGSFTEPLSIYKYSFSNDSIEPFYKTNIPIATEDFVTKQVFYQSKDGTNVPMFIVHHKDTQFNSNNPCLLYGYGGFSISLKPYFSMVRLVFLKHFKGVFAMANLRGGDEFGDQWHLSGVKEKKQNVYDDFHSAAEYLIQQKYTSSQKLTIQGGSNGGLLVSVCFNQRPDLYACIICQVPVIDMLRFHKFTIGSAWCTEYGCAENKDEFAFLYEYSPLHWKHYDTKKQYPACLVLTSDHDDRVVPLHSFKFLANIQEKLKSNEKPLMGRIESKSGHGAGMSLRKILEQYADVFTFMSIVMDLPYEE